MVFHTELIHNAAWAKSKDEAINKLMTIKYQSHEDFLKYFNIQDMDKMELTKNE